MNDNNMQLVLSSETLGVKVASSSLAHWLVSLQPQRDPGIHSKVETRIHSKLKSVLYNNPTLIFSSERWFGLFGA